MSPADKPPIPPAAESASRRLEASHAAIAAALAAGTAPTPREIRHAGSGVASWLLDAADAGLSRHPVRAGVHLASEAVSASVAPLVRDHPWAVVGAAAAGGALVAAVRPWRWAGHRAPRSGVLFSLATPLLLQVLSRAMAPRPAPVRPPEPG